MSSGDSPKRDGSPLQRTSKKRKVLSCYACRERKMKCDRVYPVCSRCQKTGRADSCTYDPRLQEDPLVNGDGHVDGGIARSTPQTIGENAFSSTHIPSESIPWKLRDQERRIENLERKLAAVDNPSNSDRPASEPRFREHTMFRGKGFKTQFYGSTSTWALISQFGELQSFTREALSSGTATMGPIRNVFKAFRSQRKAFFKEKGVMATGTDAEIRSLVPSRSTVDAAVTLYFQRFEDTYRVLHEPSFWIDYNVFWDPQHELPKSSSFAAILILLVAVTKCLGIAENTVFIGDSSVEREAAVELIEACDAWLMRQSRKHLTLAFFQLQCLSILAKRINSIKAKQDWVSAGDLVRLAIATGIHRDPSLLKSGRVSEFDKEMRRRLWSTMMELELQSSIDSGLQSSLCGLHFDVPPPSNISDDAFSTVTEQIPAPTPPEHFTKTSYLVWSRCSLTLRVHLTQLLNNPTNNIVYADVLHYDAQITSLLSSLPTWNDPRAAVASALLDLQLRQFLVILHRPYAMEASKSPRFVYSFTACVDASSKVLAMHEDLIDRGIFVLNHIRNDVLRTAMVLAQVVYANSVLATPHRPPPAESIPTPQTSEEVPPQAGPNKSSLICSSPLGIPSLPQHDFLATTLCTTSIQLMDRARTLFEHRLLRLGTGYMESWLLTAAIGIMPSTTSTTINTVPNDNVNTRAQKAIERITSHCFRVLAMQQDPNNEFASSLRTTLTQAASNPDLLHSAASGSGLTPLSHNGTDISAPAGIQQPFLGDATQGMLQVINDAATKRGTDMDMQGWSDGGLADLQGDLDLGMWDFPDIWSFD